MADWGGLGGTNSVHFYSIKEKPQVQKVSQSNSIQTPKSEIDEIKLNSQKQSYDKKLDLSILMDESCQVAHLACKSMYKKTKIKQLIKILTMYYPNYKHILPP